MAAAAAAAAGAYRDDGRHDEDLEKLVIFFRGQDEDAEKDHTQYTPRKRRGNVQLPTGWGKTGLALKLIANMTSTTSSTYSYSSSYESSTGSLKKKKQRQQPINTILYVTPRLSLADQMLDHADQMKIFEGTIPHEQRLIVASKTNRTEMRTTDPKQIAKFLHGQDSNKNNQQIPLPLRLVVCTYQSLPKLAEALKLLPHQQNKENARKIGLAVFDEAHCMAGVGKLTGFGISDNNIPIDYRLFLTATPRVFTPQPQEVKVIGSRNRRNSDQSIHLLSLHEHHREGEEEERIQRRTDVRSFDNTKLFGSTVVRRSLRESIDTGRTVPLKLCVVDRSEISRVAGVRIEDTTDWTPEEMLPFVLKAGMKKTNATRAVSFHPRNIDAQTFVQRARKVFRDEEDDNSNEEEEDSGTIIKDINGKMHPSEREAVLKSIETDNINNCEEGEEDNDKVTIIKDINGDMHPSEREAVLKSIETADGRSVIANCKVMAIGVDKSYLDMVFLTHPIQSREMIRQMIGRVSRLHLNKECAYVLVPAIFGATEDFNDNKDDEEEEDDVSSLYSSRAYQTFLTVLQVLAEDNPTVRRDLVFVSEKSDQFGRSLELSEYPESLLELFMPPSSWTKQETELLMNNLIREVGLQADALWDKAYGLLLDYKDKYGDCNAPFRHKEQGTKLGWWLAKQRQLKRQGQLLDVRERKLEEAGVVWEPTQARWEEWFRLLRQYCAREGYCNVPKRHVEEGKKLGNWVTNQRQLKKQGKLGQDKIKLLEQWGFVWEINKDDIWEAWFQLLRQYHVREGHCIVPQGHVEEGKKLGHWVMKQRNLKRKGKLEQDRIRRLERLGLIWELNKRK